jgi:hypothetical protein
LVVLTIAVSFCASFGNRRNGLSSSDRKVVVSREELLRPKASMGCGKALVTAIAVAVLASLRNRRNGLSSSDRKVVVSREELLKPKASMGCGKVW